MYPGLVVETPTFSKLENTDTEPTLRSAVDLISSQLERNAIRTDLVLEPITEVNLVGQRTIFIRIILNLLVNSLEELKKCPIDNREILVRGVIKSGNLILEIKDNGNGLEKRELKQIFEKAYTSKHRGKHFGLGLYFVKRSVEECFKGKVELNSKKGHYTTVRLIIPIDNPKQMDDE